MKINIYRKFLTLLFMMAFIMISIVPVSAASGKCTHSSQHGKKECQVSQTVGKIYTERNMPNYRFRTVNTVQKKWVCGYVDGQPKNGVRFTKGQHAYWKKEKGSTSIGYSFGIKHGDINLGSVSISVPVGKVAGSASYPTNNASSTGYYKVYVHHYYKVSSTFVEAQKYNTSKKKWSSWYKYSTKPLVTKTWLNSDGRLIKQ